jgi:hypothetical protein
MQFCYFSHPFQRRFLAYNLTGLIVQTEVGGDTGESVMNIEVEFNDKSRKVRPRARSLCSCCLLLYEVAVCWSCNGNSEADGELQGSAAIQHRSTRRERSRVRNDERVCLYVDFSPVPIQTVGLS